MSIKILCHIQARTDSAGLPECTPFPAMVMIHRETGSMHFVLQMIPHLVSNYRKITTKTCNIHPVNKYQIDISHSGPHNLEIMGRCNVNEQFVTVSKRKATKFPKQLHVWSATMHVFQL